MTLPAERPEGGVWLLSGALALALHGGVAIGSIAGFRSVAAEPPRQTRIDISALALETPQATAAQVSKSVARAEAAEAVSAVEGLTASTTDAESLTGADAEALSAAEKARALAVASEPARAPAAASTAATITGTEAAPASAGQRLAGSAALQPAESVVSKSEPPATAPPPPARTVTAGTTQRITGSEPAPATPKPAPGTTITAAAQGPAPALGVAAPAPRTVIGTEPAPPTAAPARVAAGTSAPQRVTAGTISLTSPTARVVGSVEASPDPEPATPSTPRAAVAAAAPSRPTIAAIPDTGSGGGERIAALPEPKPSVAAIAAPQPQAPPGDAPAATAPAQPTPEESRQTYRQVLDFVRGYAGGDCFAALPSLSDEDRFQFETFARSKSDLDTFRAALEEKTGVLSATTMKAISDAQCAAMQFVQEADSYPSFKLYFDLKDRSIASGTTLSGSIGGATAGVLNLILIDDEGKVQDIGSFLKFAQGKAIFEVPMTYAGGPIDTQQVLMAIVTQGRISTVKDYSGSPAPQFFQRLALELRRTGMREDIALVAFNVIP